MTYTSRDRDRGRLAVTAVTGLGAVGAITTTGWLAGAAAADFAAEQASTSTSRASGAGATSTPVVDRRPDRGRPLRQRPYITRITVRYVPGAASAPAPASGGTVTGVPPASATSSGSSGPSDSSGPGSSGPSDSGSSTPAAPSSGS